MKNSSMTKEYSRVAVAVVVLLAISGAYAGAWMYLDSAQESAQEKRQLVHQKTNAQSSGQSITEVLASTQGDREMIESYLVQRDNFVSVLEDVERVGDISGVVLTKEKVTDQGSEVIFHLRVDGAFEDVMYFLRLMETLPYRVVVRRAYTERVSGATEEQAARWRGNYDVVIFGYNLDQ
jgi:Tfp pilus assembly protein PilO